MVRTYWLVQVFNEASWNLGLQPFARSPTSKPVRARAMCKRILAPPRGPFGGAREIGGGHVLVSVLAGGLNEPRTDRLEHR